MLALKAFARLVELALMAAIALVGIGIGLYCLDGLISLGSARPDRLLHLPVVSAHVGHFLARLAVPGPTAILALLGGVVAVIVGLGLLLGLLGTRRERLLVLDDDPSGGLYVRPRTVSRMVREETRNAPGVTGVRRPKVRLSRSGRRGRLKVLAARGPDPDAATVDRSVHDRIDPIAAALHLKSDVRVRLAEPRAAYDVAVADADSQADADTQTEADEIEEVER
jgi:hypothetical protein